MQSIDFDHAYYIKLGEKGKWEQSSIKEGSLRNPQGFEQEL